MSYKTNKFYPSLINLSFRNNKIEESVAPIKNLLSKTSFEYSLGLKKSYKNKSTRNIKKFYINQPINFSKSVTDYYKIRAKKILHNDNNQSEKAILDEQKLSKNIFNDLNTIQKTLMKKYKINNTNNNTDINKKENINNNNYDKSYGTITIKNNNSFNDIGKKINKTIKLKRNRRVKSTIEGRPKQITRFLERKKINDLPVTFPLFLSHNNKYTCISEKNRVDKILSKLICLKTHILKDNLNKYEIIKEFLIKNGFNEQKYFQMESLNNLYYYLLQPFTFPPKYILQDIINEGINFKSRNIPEEILNSENINFLDYSTNKKRLLEEKIKKRTRNKKNENNSFNGLMMDNKYITRYLNSDSVIKKALPNLIKDLESELKQIHFEKMEKLDKYNNLFSKKEEMVKLIDSNKYVPNLCLVSQGFKEKYRENVDKKNRKIIKTKNMHEKLKEINNRLYYDIIRKHNLAQFDRVDIQRKLKLTEFVVMQRAKKKYLFENAKNNYTTILKKIKLYKQNIQ